MSLKLLLYIAAGGAIGASMRFVIANGMHKVLGAGFPYGTLAVNVVGSFMIGVLYIVMLERLLVDANWRALIITGFLGALTTFSTFSLETLQLIEDGAMVKAGANVAGNVVICLAVCWLGILMGRQIHL